MPKRPLRWWPIVTAFAAALSASPVAAAAHHPGFGHNNPLAAGDLTSTSCDSTASCIFVTNTAGRGVTGYVGDGVGVFGHHTATTGTNSGVWGISNSTSAGAVGVLGEISSTNAGADSAGVKGTNAGADIYGYGVHGHHNGAGYGVHGTTPNGSGVVGFHTSSFGSAPGVLGWTNSTSSDAAGVFGQVTANSAGSSGVNGHNFSTGAFGIGVRGSHSGSGNGVFGSVAMSNAGAAGVLGQVNGTGAGGVGVHGHHNGGGYGVYGNAAGAGGVGVAGNQGTPTGYAGYFSGRVTVTGPLTKGGGAFKIDHPLDPQNKYLQHSFVESPDMMNVYNGNVRTDRRGFATVKLPRYFSALNRDFRYQLTSLSGLQDVAIAKKIENNRFTIQSEKPFAEVSWQVTGIRKDRWANANRIQVEQAKPASERGKYLNPELYGAGEAKSLRRPPPLGKNAGWIARTTRERRTR